MKNLIYSLLLAIFAVTPAMAQPPDDGPPEIPEERLQEIKAQKSAYLTQKMNLTPEEAQRFWPLYNKYDEELETARREHMKYMREMRRKEGELTEKEANEMLDRQLAMHEKDLAIRKKYDPQLRKEIGARKLVQLLKAERDFHREVVKRFRERGDGPRDGGGRPGKR
jgi:uncharacterized protein YwgA